MVFGVDIVGEKRYALFMLEKNEGKVISKAKLFRLIRKFRPSIIAVDNVFELFESKEELISFLRNAPTNTKLVQVAGRCSLNSLAKRFRISMNPRNPMDEAKACAYLAKLGVGEEVSVFTNRTVIIVSRNRSLGRGGWRQKKYMRKIHNSVRQVFNDVKAKLDELGFDYFEDVKRGFGGISRGILIVNAPKHEIPINSFRFGDVQVKVEAMEKERIEFLPLRKPFLILGVDPGTTTAVASLDLDGNLVDVRSKKGWSCGDVIEYITSIGKPVVIATDKSNPPELVLKLKASFNAVLWTPKEDMSVEKKRTLASRYRYLNDHERDAIAVAISAYNSFKNKIRNVEKRIPHNLDRDFVKAEVIRGTELKDIVKCDERREEKVEKEKVTRQHSLNFRIVEELKRENEMLRKKLKEMSEEVERLKKRLVEMSKETYERIRRENVVRSLKDEIKELRGKLKEKDEKIKMLEKIVEDLRRMKLLEFKGWKSVKVLKKFTRDEIDRVERDIGLEEGDILLIEDASCGGRSGAEYLCEKGIKAVIVKNEISHLARSVFEEMDVPIIDSRELEILDGEFFALVKNFDEVYDRRLEDMRRRKIERIEEMILEYRMRKI